MFSVDNYLSSVKERLYGRTNLLVENLKKILGYNFSADIDLLDFSTFIEPTRFEISIILFSMDKEANEVFNEENDLSIFAGSVEVLPEVEYYHLSDSQLDLFFNFYETNEETLMPLEQKLFTEWFKECWEKAGGKTIKLPTYFTFHDDDKSFDLKNSLWVDDELKWI